MANPRKLTAYEGMNSDFATYAIDAVTITYDATQANGAAATMIGKAVTLSAARTVALCADGDRVVGKLVDVQADGFCTVQVDGFMSLPGGASASLTLGKAIVGALGAASAKGYIREVATGTAAELGKCDGCIVDAGDTTAVVVDL